MHGLLHCISFGQASPFLRLIEQLRENFQIDEFDGEPEMIAKIEQGMRRMGELEAHIPAIRYLLSVDPGDPALAAMEGMARRRQLFAALRALLLRGARLRPHRLAEHYTELAHHFTQGETWEKACNYCRQAGEKALERSAYREAVGSFEPARAALAVAIELYRTMEMTFWLKHAETVLAQMAGYAVAQVIEARWAKELGSGGYSSYPRKATERSILLAATCYSAEH